MLPNLFDTAQYCIGITEIDQQHQELILLINQLAQKKDSPMSQDDLRESLTFLQAYVDVHFHDEEALMAESRYAGHEAHKAHHHAFRKQVEALVCKLRTEPVSPEMIDAVTQLMLNWLFYHIDVEDRAFGASIVK